MRVSTTNIKKKEPSTHIPSNSLHVKILDLVTNRINPYKKDLYLDNQACKTCISIQKKSSYDLSDRKDMKKQLPQNKQKSRMSKQPQSQKATKPTTHNNSLLDLQNSNISTISAKCQQKHPIKHLSISSKVISLIVENTKAANLTIDLRGEIQNQFVSSKMLSKIKLQNLQKQERIIQLEHQIQLKEFYIKQLNKDIEYFQQFARRKSYSDNHLNNNQAISNVSHEPLSLKEVFTIQSSSSDITQLDLKKKQSRTRQQKLGNDYDDLFRIIKTQAKQLQRMKQTDPFTRRLSIPKNN